MVFLVFKGVIFYEKSLLGTCLKCSVFVAVKNKNKLTGLLCAPRGGRFFKINYFCTSNLMFNVEFESETMINDFFLRSFLFFISIFVYTNSYTMAIVETTSRQFRERQKDFFDMVDKGKK
jgi:hypothetical protein